MVITMEGKHSIFTFIVTSKIKLLSDVPQFKMCSKKFELETHIEEAKGTVEQFLDYIKIKGKGATILGDGNDIDRRYLNFLLFFLKKKMLNMLLT
jgi:hypothetical protein